MLLALGSRSHQFGAPGMAKRPGQRTFASDFWDPPRLPEVLAHARFFRALARTERAAADAAADAAPPAQPPPLS